MTGLGVVSPLGIGLVPLWRGICRRSCPPNPEPADAGHARRVPSFSSDAYGSIDRLDRVRTRTFELLCAAAHLARIDAAVDGIDASRIGLVVAVGRLEERTVDLRRVLALMRSAGPDGSVDPSAFLAHFDPMRRLRTLPNVASALVSIAQHVAGPSITLVGGVIGGLQAVLEGQRLIEAGEADIVYCGGVEGLASSTSLAHGLRRCRPGELCLPFDVNSRGAIAAEGAALVVLERHDSAAKRGVAPYAELMFGSCTAATGCDAFKHVYDEMFRAACAPIDLVLANADGTQATDSFEAAAIARHLDRLAPAGAVTTVKRSVGHTVVASGAINTVAACLALRCHRVPVMAAPHQPWSQLPFAGERAIRRALDQVLVTTAGPYDGVASVMLCRV